MRPLEDSVISNRTTITDVLPNDFAEYRLLYSLQKLMSSRFYKVVSCVLQSHGSPIRWGPVDKVTPMTFSVSGG